nr:molybdenum cofactor guanylyltransferase [uncultured Carboxylicivirga sp.]
MKKNITALILSGGKSSRMGVDKGLMKFNGRPMITYAINAVEPNCQEIFISANSDDYQQFNLPIIKDTYNELGPLSGIFEGLVHSSNDWIFVTTCDMPNITPKSVAYLINQRDKDTNCIVASFNEQRQPLFACYHKSLIEDIRKALKEKKLKMQLFIESCQLKVVSMNNFVIDNPDLFANINDKNDLQI